MPIPDTRGIVTVPVVTPFDEQDRVDHDALASNVGRWMETPLSGFIIGSATGEEWLLSETEKIEIMRTAGQALSGPRFLIGGIDCPSVTETLRRAEAFAEAGAELVRVRLPRYESAVERYFEQLLPRCPLPALVMHQCNPERFGWAGVPAAAPEVIGRVVNSENVFGYVTDHDVRFASRVRRHVAPERPFWICNGSLILFGTLLGCNGTTTAIANVWPQALQELLRAGLAGQYQQSWPLQDQVQRVDEAMLAWGAAGVKAALRLLGFEGMRPRRPLAPMPPADVERLEQVMRGAGLLN